MHNDNQSESYSFNLSIWDFDQKLLEKKIAIAVKS